MRRITEVSRVEAETRENTGSFYLNSGVLTPLAPHRVAYWYSYQLPPVAGFFPLRALCEPRVRTSENNPALILAATDFLSASCSSKLHPRAEHFGFRKFGPVSNSYLRAPNSILFIPFIPVNYSALLAASALSHCQRRSRPSATRSLVAESSSAEKEPEGDFSEA